MFALQARWVLPVDSAPLAGGVVTIENERIVAVGDRAESGVKVLDLGDVVLLPGLVNAHTHLEFSQLAEPLGHPGMSLPEWVRLVISGRRQQTDVASGLAAGLHESLQAGVTSIGEIATSQWPFTELHTQPELVAFQEVIGFSAARVESVFAKLQHRLESKHSPCRQGISPHAPYTVHPRLLKKIVELASQRGLPVAMHLAESREELRLMRENQGAFRELLEGRSMWDGEVFAKGVQPLDYLRVLAQAPRAVVVHGNYLSHSEIEFVGDRRDRMSIVYCPRTHAFFRHDSYPLNGLLSAGVRVAVGTDSRASNPDLNLLSELRYVARTYKDIELKEILKLGTINGAEALGMANEVGSLAPGKLANLTTLECGRSEQEPLTAVLCGENQPLQTWLRGGEISVTDC